MNKVFGFSFDLDTVRMTDSGVTDSERSKMYMYEIPAFLSELGFEKHMQGSVYRTGLFSNPEILKESLIEELDKQNPKFRRWVKSCEIYVLEAWSDVTAFVKYGSQKKTKRNQRSEKGNRSKVKSISVKNVKSKKGNVK
ncbi:hypothetical protein LFX25_03515 [Leptospira sp. FAT2]|uniref:hypothetical protein n=1 Tax=Leptospira sanjuanensis TaxID=2879643 RepID=UPI001EE93FE3|nr:hypothetical protein [Leptospira sanjuanensis]MCG6192308.1 hypothetical protein [Leptospira sanjuanensis]